MNVGVTGSAGQFRIKLLAGEPTTVDGDVLVAREQLAFFGAVAKGSQLEAAYAEVLQEHLGTPSPAPAPT
jgi:hypothetical protein